MVQPLHSTSGTTWPYQSSETQHLSPVQTSPSFEFTFSSLFPFDTNAASNNNNNNNNSFTNSQQPPSSPTDSESSSSTGASYDDPYAFQFVSPTEILFNPYLDQDVDWMTLSFPSSPDSLSSPVQFRFPDVPKTLPTPKTFLESSRPSPTPPSAKRQRTMTTGSATGTFVAAKKPSTPEPCPCCYCNPSPQPSTTLTNAFNNNSTKPTLLQSSTRPRPAPLQPTPLPTTNTILKLDLLPSPLIITPPQHQLLSQQQQQQQRPSHFPTELELPSNEPLDSPKSDAATVYKQQQAAIEQARKMMQQSPFPAAVRGRRSGSAGSGGVGKGEKGMDGFEGRPFFGDARSYF